MKILDKTSFKKKLANATIIFGVIILLIIPGIMSTYSESHFICSYPKLKLIHRGLTKEQVLGILDLPDQKIVKPNMNDYTFAQGEKEKTIKEGWIYEFFGWDGGIEIYFDKNGLKKSSCEQLPSWKQTPLAATIKDSGNSKNYNTGNWVRTSCNWNPETCINCNLCWPVCPHDAIKVDTQGNMLGVDEKKCTACGLCVVACPTNPKSLKIIPKKSSEI